MDEGEALDGGNPDPQPGERARARGDGVAVDLVERRAVIRDQRDEIAGQPLGVRSRRVTRPLVDQPVAPERHAAAPGRRVEGENQHWIRL